MTAPKLTLEVAYNKESIPQYPNQHVLTDVDQLSTPLHNVREALRREQDERFNQFNENLSQLHEKAQAQPDSRWMGVFIDGDLNLWFPAADVKRVLAMFTEDFENWDLSEDQLDVILGDLKHFHFVVSKSADYAREHPKTDPTLSGNISQVLHALRNAVNSFGDLDERIKAGFIARMAEMRSEASNYPDDTWLGLALAEHPERLMWLDAEDMTKVLTVLVDMYTEPDEPTITVDELALDYKNELPIYLQANVEGEPDASSVKEFRDHLMRRDKEKADRVRDSGIYARLDLDLGVVHWLRAEDAGTAINRALDEDLILTRDEFMQAVATYGEQYTHWAESDENNLHGMAVLPARDADFLGYPEGIVLTPVGLARLEDLKEAGGQR